MSHALSSEGSEALADSEIHSLIENHVRDMMAEGAYGYESQKTNLEERNYLDLMQAVSNSLDSFSGQLTVFSGILYYLNKL